MFRDVANPNLSSEGLIAPPPGLDSRQSVEVTSHTIVARDRRHHDFAGGGNGSDGENVKNKMDGLRS